MREIDLIKTHQSNEDGSLDWCIQKELSGIKLAANWLPTSDGPSYDVMRHYGPKEEALKGSWMNPPMVKNN